ADQSPDRIRRIRRVRVGEDQDLAGGRGDSGIQRTRLAGPWQIEDADPRILATSYRHRPVGRSVGRDDDLEAVTRVVDCEQVLDAGNARALLVMRRGHGAHSERSSACAEITTLPSGVTSATRCGRGRSLARSITRTGKPAYV